MKARIKARSVVVNVELLGNETAKAIYTKLPIRGVAQTWGEEIYFEIPVHVELDGSAREVVEKGDLGFWPTGDCFCIFFGKTPASRGNEIKPASAVNVFGRVIGDTSVLKFVKDGDKIFIEKTTQSK